MTAPPDPAVAGGRIPGLDAWRAGLMLAGLLVHARFLQDPRPLFDLVAFLSAHFRMGVFMAIAGLFAGTATAGEGARGWMRRRARRLAAPLLTGMAVTGPAIALLGRGADGRTPGLAEPHHLWFLMALLLHLPLVPAFDAAERRFGVVGRLERRASVAGRLQLLVLGPVCACSTLLIGGAALAQARWAPAAELTSGHAHQILGFAPTFALGLLLGRAPRLLRALASDARWPLAGLAATLLAEHLWSGDPGGLALRVAAVATCSVLAAVLALRSALAIRSVGPAVRRLSDASLTMYVVHFPIVAALNAGFARLAWNVYAEYALAVLVGGWLSYAFHRHAVRRSPMLAMLFNGRFGSGGLGRPAPPALARGTAG